MAESLSTTEMNKHLIVDFISYLQHDDKISSSSAAAYRSDLFALCQWLSDKKHDLLLIDSRVINLYFLSRLGKGFKTSSNARQLSSIKKLYTYLLGMQKVSSDPSFAIKLPRVIPKAVQVLTQYQIELLMSAPNVHERLGLRDRVMLEVLCSTGVKVSELIALRLTHLNLKTSSILVATTNHTRSVYLTKQCCEWLQKYRSITRHTFIKQQDDDWLFLSERGCKMTRQAFWYRIKGHVVAAGLDFVVSGQVLRHSFAVHLLREGIELPVVQQVMGHRKIASTSKYSKV